MLGGMLAGVDECEGEWVEQEGRRVALAFYGMSSRKALDRYSGGRKDYRACEGKEIEVRYKGPVRETIQEIAGGIRSACAYVGATRLKDLSKCTTFVIRGRPNGQGLSPPLGVQAQSVSRGMLSGRDDLEAEDAAGMADVADFIDGSDRQVVLADGQRSRDVHARTCRSSPRWPCR